MDPLMIGVGLIVAVILVGRLVAHAMRSSQAYWSEPKRLDRHQSPPAPPTGAAPDHQTGRIVSQPIVIEGRARIVDGDTLIIGRTSIRLFGIDAPEIDHPYGNKAKWALIGLCKGQDVTATLMEADHYGRLVARCTLKDGRDLSAEMVKLGLAIDWPKHSGGRYLRYEVSGARKRMWLANARQKGRMDVWKRYEARRAN
ncbi:thermonuclease family protein [Jannaschia sp. LMIT008]|uniref:thermonuclease family protein n=1 Tax=Jannaschia maritima TaxID=3032585 RepID=UPI0028111623|nr:thermonuclease family protein [Jannaschia sp. LMIT008]